MRRVSASLLGAIPATRPGSVTFSAEIVTSALVAFATCATSPSGTSATTQSPVGSPISTSGSPPGCTMAPGVAFTETITPSTCERTLTLVPWPPPASAALRSARSSSPRASRAFISASKRSTSSPTPFFTISFCRASTSSAVRTLSRACASVVRRPSTSALSMVKSVAPLFTFCPGSTSIATTRPAKGAVIAESALGRNAVRPK